MAIKDEVLWTKIEPQTPVLPEATPIPMTQDQLKAKIATGDFTASEARQYNQMTWSNTWARDVALTSQSAMKNQDFQTAVTPQEVWMMQDAWIKQVNSDRITLDTTAPVITQAPVNPVTPTPTKAETPSVKIESIEQFKQKGANLPNLEQFIEDRYGSTATQEDGWVTSVINGEKFKWTIDSQGNPNKVSLGKVDQPVVTTDTVYQSLVSWQSVDKNIPWYADAKKRYDAYNMYAIMTDNQLSSSLWKGNILPGTQVYEDLMKDPIQKARLERIQQYNIVTGKTPKTEEVFINKSKEIANNTKVNIGWQTMTLSEAMTDGYISQDEVNAFTNNSEIITKAKEVEALKNEYDSALAIYKNVEKDIKEQWKGTWATKMDIAIATANAREKLLPWLQELESRTNNALWTLTQMRTDSAQLFATNLSLYNQQQSRQQQLEDRQYQEDLATRRMQQEYDFTYGDFNSQDPRVRDTAIRNAVAQLYTQYPIPWMEAPAVKEQKVKSLMAQGLTGEQAISQLEQEIRSTNRYKQMITPEQTSTQDWAKLSDGTLYNQRTWETRSVWATWEWLWDLRSLASQFPWQAWAKNNNPAWITWNANFDTWKWTAALLKEAWINFTKGTSRPASEWGSYVSFDTIEDGLKAQRIIMTQTYGNSTVEQMLGKWVWTWEALNYAKQVAWNAWIDLKTKVNSLNDNQISQLQMAKIQKESPGLFNILNQPSQTTEKQYTDQQIWELSYLVELQEKNPTQASKDMKELWYGPKDLANYKAWNMPLTDKQKNSSIEVLNSIQDLITNYDWNDAIGKFDISRWLWLQWAEDAKIVLDNLIAKMTLPNLWVLKWPMSDKDIEFIKAASSKLWTTQSNKSFEKNIIEAYNLAARRAWKPEIKTLADLKTTNTWTPTENAYNDANDYLKSLWY